MEAILLICIGIAVYYGYMDDNQILHYLMNNAPSIFYSDSRKNLRGLFAFDEHFITYAILYATGFCLSLGIFVGIYLTWTSFKFLNKSTVGDQQQTFVVRTSLRERRLNKMILKLIIYEGWLAVSLIFFPLLISTILLIVKAPYSAQITEIIIALSCFYSFFDGILLIYNVKPYRRFVVLLFKKLFGPPEDIHRPGSPSGVSVLSAN